MRPAGAGHGGSLKPLTVEFSAQPGTLRGGLVPSTATTGQDFTPVTLPVTFPAGATTATAVVPVNPAAPNPGLVPIPLSVTPRGRSRAATTTTVYLASGPSAVPPSIVSAQLVRLGPENLAIALTFSKPMSPATVKNIHNYSITFRSSQQFGVSDLNGLGLVQTIVNPRHTVALRAASYEAATSTVTLIPNIKLKITGSYEIRSPASLGSRRHSANQAQPLTDVDGNAINLGTTSVIGAFAISISRGHPYFAAEPTFAQGS